ncbi:glycosyltransferase family 1 protein [Microvirga thermotolerans]|uniref:Uncharacterized protein n=1 Tax=Microvirga thermotolerans TaxID=2651334 RepID=A0A5P9JUS4_9HYPH|nr:glycosyltransferase family 1 protein [Microvirga thermotolerans]QFU15929.1 hypothetical protein GDR74_06670 [Microvirga thermotolerans]
MSMLSPLGDAGKPLKRIRVLVAYASSSVHARAIVDYLIAFKKYTSFDVYYVNVVNGVYLDFELDEFDVVINSYCARLIYDGYVSDDYKRKLRRFRGLKIVSVQDDCDRTSIMHTQIRELGFHVLLTAVPSDTLAYGYPPDKIPGVEIFPVLTGYVANDFADLSRPVVPLEQRPFVLGYRGRDIGGRYGTLGYYKYIIGTRMRNECEARGVIHNISVAEGDRIYGDAWFQFLGECRAVLGTESGTNVWDFDGSLEQKFQSMTDQLGRKPTYEEFYPFVAEHEGKSNIGEISPRHFEAAVMRTPMVMFRGRYSDLLDPGVHYIPLEKDFSNLDDVFATLHNFKKLEQVSENAYERLVASGDFTYRKFAESIEALIRRKLALIDTPPSTSSASHISTGSLLQENASKIALGGREVPTEWPRHASFSPAGEARLLPELYAYFKERESTLSEQCIRYRTAIPDSWSRAKSAFQGLLDLQWQGSFHSYKPPVNLAFVEKFDVFEDSVRIDIENFEREWSFICHNQAADIEYRAALSNGAVEPVGDSAEKVLSAERAKADLLKRYILKQDDKLKKFSEHYLRAYVLLEAKRVQCIYRRELARLQAAFERSGNWSIMEELKRSVDTAESQYAENGACEELLSEKRSVVELTFRDNLESLVSHYAGESARKKSYLARIVIKALPMKLKFLLKRFARAV